LSDVGEALKLTEEKFKEEQDKDKKEMYNRLLDKTRSAIERLTKNPNGVSDVDKKELIESSNDVLSTWLDKKEGKNITDNSIFAKLPRHYEDEFYKDMAALNVRFLFFNVLILIASKI
jgi:cysteinyl-tRNA synthetase